MNFTGENKAFGFNLFFLTANPMEDCKSLKDAGNTTGIYNIRPCLICPIMSVYCDMDTDGGGWMVS